MCEISPQNVSKGNAEASNIAVNCSKSLGKCNLT